MPPPQLFVTITTPPSNFPVVDRTFQVAGNIEWMFTPANWSLTSKSVSVQFGPGGPTVGGTFVGATRNWQCSGTVLPSVPWGSTVQLTVRADATFRFFHTPSEPDVEFLSVTTTYMVQLVPAILPTINLAAIPAPVVAAQMPVSFAFTGSATSPQAPITLVQYRVEGGQFANAVNVSGNWSQFRITLPLPPTAPGNDHTLTIRAVDTFGTSNQISRPFAVQAQPPIVVPPGSNTTFTGAPTASSITSWTRLEPQSTGADMGTSASARMFDPLWMLARQWQMGEFQGEDAGTPIQARLRATSAMLTRRFLGELPKPTGTTPIAVAARAYDPGRTPLEALVERRRMRPADDNDARMLPFASDAGLHFLRMLEVQTLSRYRSAFITRFALQQLAPAAAALADEGTVRYMQSMVGRTMDGRRLALALRTSGVVQLAADPTLNIATADRVRVQTAATEWLAWYDAIYTEPTDAADDAWIPSRLEYQLAVGTRFSAQAGDEMTLSAKEIDGPIDWTAFDVNADASLTTSTDQSGTSLVEAVVPAPVSFPGSPAPRFWEMEDARLAYGLVPVGPTDLAHLLLIEYASTYGNDWFVVPLTLPVGSVTRVDSLVVTDTFGVRNLVRPLGDAALLPAFFSMWQPSLMKPVSGQKVATNRFVLPPTVYRSLDSTPLEDVLFMRDEMANVAWAIERIVESPLEQSARRDEAADAAPRAADDPTSVDLPRYVLASPVPPNWIPLLPVQIPNPLQPPNTPGQVLSRLKRGAVLQPDGSRRIHTARGEVLSSAANLLLYDEEVSREGTRITRQRRLARWTDGSTWVWTAFRNEAGLGEGSSALVFDRVHEPSA